MEFGFVFIVAIAWAVINALREAGKKLPGERPDPRAGRPPGPRRERIEQPGSFADTSPGLRDLLDAIEEARVKANAPPPKRRVPEPLPEAVPEVVRSEVFEDAAPVRRQRQELDLDSASVEAARRRRESAARRDAPRTAADHDRFDARIRKEAADATAVAVPAESSRPDLRQALIWREILGPPKSLRDD